MITVGDDQQNFIAAVGPNVYSTQAIYSYDTVYLFDCMVMLIILAWRLWIRNYIQLRIQSSCLCDKYAPWAQIHQPQKTNHYSAKNSIAEEN